MILPTNFLVLWDEYLVTALLPGPAASPEADEPFHRGGLLLRLSVGYGEAVQHLADLRLEGLPAGGVALQGQALEEGKYSFVVLT